MEEKQFINGFWIKQHDFANGGFIIKISAKLESVDSICAQLKAAAKPDGWINLEMKPHAKKKTDANGREVQHWGLSVDTWGADKTPPASNPWG